MTAASATHRRTFLERVFDEPASVRSLAILRIALGPIVLLHLRPFLVDTWNGVTFADRFHVPWWGFVPDLPGEVQIVLVWAGALAAVVLSLGWRTRIVAPLTFLCVAGNLFLSQTHFHHNRAFLLILLGGVALGQSGRVLSLDARRRRALGLQVDDRAPVWPLWLLRALVSSVYFASGFSKLIDPDWVGGLVLWDRAVRYQQAIHDSILPAPVVDLVTTRAVHAVTSPLVVATELFIAFGLWFPRTRLAAVWMAIVFHLSIEVTSSVQVFSLAGIAALVVWAAPATRDRTVVTTPARARWVRRLDWLARFHLVEDAGAELQVVDRDGASRTGRDAWLLVAGRLPVLFPLAGPMRRWR